jgi:hypothetical protein
MRSPIHRAVLRSLDHLGNDDYIAAVFTEHGVLPVLRACRDLLGERRFHAVQPTSRFLVGFRFSSASEALRGEVYGAAPRLLAPSLRRLLRARERHMRRLATYTIGQLQLRREAKSLRRVFPWYVKHDPLGLPDLLLELGWLHDARGVSARLRRMVRDPSFIVRWAALGYNDHVVVGRRGPYRRERLSLLSQLTRDEVPAIAAEARYQLDELRREAREPAPDWNEPAAARERRIKASIARQPPLTFTSLELQFHNRLSKRRQRDYTPAEFALFARAQGAFNAQ